MKNLLTVHEYEKIFPDDCPHFDELAKLSSASDFLNLGWHFVQAKNYVGVIRLPSGFQIEILPKLDAPNEKLRALVVKMLRALKNFSGKKFREAQLDSSRLPLYEIFIRNYLEMISELVKRGLKSSYVVREDNLNFFKGRLLIGQHVRKNFAHSEKSFVTFDEYSLNRPEHRLIKATLDKLARATRDRENFRAANLLLACFDSVESSTNFAKDFAATAIDRQNRDYANVLAWTKIFLAGKSFTAFAGESAAQTLLFPMEKLFEAYVAEHVRKNFSDAFTVKTQVREKFLFDEPKCFALKPDILLESPAERIILDTKWKLRISESDLYQMFTYSKRYAAPKIFLLCPPNDDGENFYRSSEDNFSVRNFFVDLFDINESMNNLRETLKKNPD